MSDIKHDFVQVYRAKTNKLTVNKVHEVFYELKEQGLKQLKEEGFSESDISYNYSIDMMYEGQFFEVNVPFTQEEMDNITIDYIEEAFHKLHEKRFGYHSLEMDVLVLNFNLSVIGSTQKPSRNHRDYHGISSEHARKGQREVVLTSAAKRQPVNVYDGHQLYHGNFVEGPAIIEQTVTTIVVPEDFSVICDKNDNYILFNKKINKNKIQSFVEKHKIFSE